MINDLIKKLKAIEPHVTAQDRKEACEKFKMDKAFVSEYLNGYGRNVDRGIALLEFFHDKIKERQKRLDAVDIKVA